MYKRANFSGTWKFTVLISAASHCLIAGINHDLFEPSKTRKMPLFSDRTHSALTRVASHTAAAEKVSQRIKVWFEGCFVQISDIMAITISSPDYLSNLIFQGRYLEQ